MPKSLESLSKQEAREVESYLVPIMNRYGIQSIGQFGYSAEASDVAIEVLSEQLAVNPNRTGLWSAFSFLYARQHRYVDAIEAAKQLEKLQPKSARGAYLQANFYMSLLDAIWATKSDSPEWIAQLQAMSQQRSGESGVSTAPLESLAELKKLGITIEEAAQRAYNLSQRVLQQNLHPYDRKVMLAVIETCQEMFPNIQKEKPATSKSFSFGNLLATLGLRRNQVTSNKPQVDLNKPTFPPLNSDKFGKVWSCTLKFEEGVIFTSAISKLPEDIVKKELENSPSLRDWRRGLQTLMLPSTTTGPAIVSPVGLVVERGSVKVIDLLRL
jgi:hypothetical protein